MVRPNAERGELTHQPAGVLATWLEAALRDELRPWFVHAHTLLQAAPDPVSVQSTRLLQSLQRLHAGVELLEATARSSGGVIARMWKFLDRDRDARLRGDLADVQQAFQLAESMQQGAIDAHEQQASALEGMMLRFDQDLPALEKRLQWCGLALDAMQRKLLLRMQEADDGPGKLLTHLAKCARSCSARLEPLQAVVADMRELRTLATGCLTRRGAILLALRAELPGHRLAWTTALTAVQTRARGHRAEAADQDRLLQEATERLRAFLAQEARSLVQVRVEEERLAEAQNQLEARLSAALQASEWQEPLTAPTSLIGAIAPSRSLDRPGPESSTDLAPATDSTGSLAPVRTGIADAMAIARRNNRACPHPDQWSALHEVLLACALRSQRVPPLGPIAREEWAQVSALNKRLRLREQLTWAQGASCLDEVIALLASLDERDWEHMQDSG